MANINEIEIPFRWTCPTCGHSQGDTVNPELGPYLSVTCGKCCASHDERTLTPADAEAWEAARVAAEAHNAA